MDNRQYGAQQATAVKPVRSIQQGVGKILAIVGGALFGVAVILFVISFVVDDCSAALALRIAGGSQAFAGFVTLVISAFFRMSAARWQNKLARLKAEGASFPAEIIKIHWNMAVRVNNAVSAYAECSYQNKEGKTCLVRSKPFLYNNETHSAIVHVSPYDPADYVVEVFVQVPHVQADYDYR